MITYWAPRDGKFTIEVYLAKRGASIADRFVVREYESLSERTTVAPGAHIFSAIDQLTAAQREAVAAVYDQVRALHPDNVVLNDPRRVRLRYDLLETLAAQGVNRFRAYRASAAAQVQRFPVFVREESRHTGNQTGLLYDQASLRRALFALRARGFRLQDLLIVEFLDTVDASGVYRKYSAYRLGEAIVPTHVLAGRRWAMKSEGSDKDVALLEEERAFIDSNPHARWLREIFDLARIEFGRIDYAMLDGTPQVWEINTNPTMGRNPRRARKALTPAIEAAREPVREAQHALMRPAFTALDRRGATRETAVVALEPALVRRMHREMASRDRASRLRGFARAVYEHPSAGWPVRALLRLVAPGRARALHPA